MAETKKQPSKLKNLILRTGSALILGPLIIYLLLQGGMFAYAILALLFVLMISEWAKLCLRADFSRDRTASWLAVGVIYITFASFSLMNLIGQQNGHLSFLILMLLVWSSDIGAYFFGITLGGPKLAPAISPSKTWSGSLGGIVGCVLTTFMILHFTHKYTSENWQIVAVIGFCVSVLVQLGDLLESWSKRQMNIKDSGRLIPGHGGILDRMDGLLALAIGLGILQLIYKMNVWNTLAAFN